MRHGNPVEHGAVALQQIVHAAVFLGLEVDAKMRAELAAVHDDVVADRLALRVVGFQCLIDIVMPVREGHDVIVDATRQFPDLKVLAVSGGGMAGPKEYLELALQLGAHDALAKPFRNAELVKKVKALV